MEFLIFRKIFIPWCYIRYFLDKSQYKSENKVLYKEIKWKFKIYNKNNILFYKLGKKFFGKIIWKFKWKKHIISNLGFFIIEILKNIIMEIKYMKLKIKFKKIITKFIIIIKKIDNQKLLNIIILHLNFVVICR